MNDELRERTDETLHANAFLASVLSSIQQAVVVVDRALRVVTWSSQAQDLWGLREDEVEGEHLLNLDVGVPVSRLRDPIREVLAGGAVEPLVLEGHDRRGRPTRFTVPFASLRTRRADDEVGDGVIMLVTAEGA